MTERLPFTQARIERAVKAARKLGLRVKGIRPDGTVEVEESDAPIVPEAPAQQNAPANSWDDV